MSYAGRHSYREGQAYTEDIWSDDLTIPEQANSIIMVHIQ